MTPAARVQAAIELLDAIIAAARGEGAPADRIIADWFRTRRYAGSKDRRAVRELVYGAIRACGPLPPGGRAAMLRLAQDDTAIAPLFDGSRHGPTPLRPDEQPAAGGLAPRWLEDALAASGVERDEMEALLGRAPLDIRINPLKAQEPELPLAGERTAAPFALRYPPGTPVEQWPAYQSGAIEIQDTASQLACAVTGVCGGEHVVDLCAGAGGKTLALAAMMDNRGSILACDTDRTRLSRLMPRAGRAGAAIIETRLLDPGRELAALADVRGAADLVLVDAPCSGTGTWRRNPEARWRLTSQQLERYVDLQARLLELAAQLVRPGGRVVYAVCSLLDAEGAGQVDRFLAAHGGWRADVPMLAAGVQRGQGLRLLPCRDGTDGFFVARLASPC